MFGLKTMKDKFILILFENAKMSLGCKFSRNTWVRYYEVVKTQFNGKNWIK